jgi:putative DNA primase/helicase
VIERLLSISGEDSLTVNRKHIPQWTGRLGTRFLILTNELPRFLDASGALAGRFVILTLKESFYGKEDVRLEEKLIRELPGILNWALDGLDRLRKRGHFEMPKSSEEAIRMMADLAAPTSAFVRDWCELSDDKKIRRKELFAAYKKWCDLEGYRPGSAEGFGKRLKAAYPQIDTKAKLHGEHAYAGIDLTEKVRDDLAKDPEPGSRG